MANRVKHAISPPATSAHRQSFPCSIAASIVGTLGKEWLAGPRFVNSAAPLPEDITQCWAVRAEGAGQLSLGTLLGRRLPGHTAWHRPEACRGNAPLPPPIRAALVKEIPLLLLSAALFMGAGCCGSPLSAPFALVAGGRPSLWPGVHWSSGRLVPFAWHSVPPGVCAWRAGSLLAAASSFLRAPRATTPMATSAESVTSGMASSPTPARSNTGPYLPRSMPSSQACSVARRGVPGSGGWLPCEEAGALGAGWVLLAAPLFPFDAPGDGWTGSKRGVFPS